MSLKIKLDVPIGDRYAHCNIEMPLNAIAAKANGEAGAPTQEQITKFTSNTVAEVLKKAEGMFGTAAPTESEGTPTESKGTPKEQPPEYSPALAQQADIVRVVPTRILQITLELLGTRRRQTYSMKETVPLSKALALFAEYINVPVSKSALRLRDEKSTTVKEVSSIQTPEDVSRKLSTLLHIVQC